MPEYTRVARVAFTFRHCVDDVTGLDTESLELQVTDWTKEICEGPREPGDRMVFIEWEPEEPAAPPVTPPARLGDIVSSANSAWAREGGPDAAT